ncbi:MAG TPA: GTPase Era, partial [Gammaproteobacteria bacterium]|nr:GTPase Era [Gammaproteobacteria bacterium]
TAIAHVDLILFMTEVLVWNTADAQVLAMLGKTQAPIICVINKIDRLPDRDRLLPFIGQVSDTAKFEEIIPVSVLRNENIATLEAAVAKLLPVAPPAYPVDQLSNRDERFFAAEFIREKLVRALVQELPYRVAVTIERIQRQPKITKIDAVIWVEGESQKRIIVGKNGAVLKTVGEKARKDLEAMFGIRLFLRTWVKVRKNWTGNAKAMKEFGYE